MKWITRVLHASINYSKASGPALEEMIQPDMYARRKERKKERKKERTTVSDSDGEEVTAKGERVQHLEFNLTFNQI